MVAWYATFLHADKRLIKGKQNLIYKHAISTVQPAETVKMNTTA